MRNFNRGDRNERKGFGKRDFGSRSMHQATCDKCGKNCEVPFRPLGDKPIFCSACFSKNKSSDFGKLNRRDFGKPGFGNNQMFTAVCDKCGKNCEVPFKPSGGKPIFCSDCFSHNRGDGGKTAGPSKEQFEMINSKLDKILLALKPAVKEAVEARPAKKASAPVKAKVAPKKAAKKGTAVSISARLKKKKK